MRELELAVGRHQSLPPESCTAQVAQPATLNVSATGGDMLSGESRTGRDVQGSGDGLYVNKLGCTSDAAHVRSEQSSFLTGNFESDEEGTVA